MVDIKVDVELREVAGLLGQYQSQIPFAAALALTRTAQAGGKQLRSEFETKFDRPTRYTMSSVFVGPANKRNLTASFGVKDQALIQKSGGLTPADVLGHFFKGGSAISARYENAFRRLGMLGPDEDIVPGSNLAELNTFGNIPSSLIVRLIAYFNGFGQQGFTANSTAQTRAKLAKRTDKNTKGKRRSKYVTINGVVYFYARGDDHLHRGIWAKTGINGADVRPILMFVRRARYAKRFDLQQYAVTAKQNFSQQFAIALKQAVRTAR